VGHYEEIFYIFANKANANNEDKIARERLLKLWTDFMKYGNPTPVPFEGVSWRPNSPKTRSANVTYLSINSSLKMGQNPHQKDWEFYQDLYSKYGEPPYSTY